MSSKKQFLVNSAPSSDKDTSIVAWKSCLHIRIVFWKSCKWIVLFNNPLHVCYSLRILFHWQRVLLIWIFDNVVELNLGCSPSKCLLEKITLAPNQLEFPLSKSSLNIQRFWMLCWRPGSLPASDLFHNPHQLRGLFSYGEISAGNWWRGKHPGNQNLLGQNGQDLNISLS